MKNLFLGIVLGFIWFFTSLSAHADSFKATLYGDGFSCPNNCDAHVVFRQDYNATKYASLPSSSRTQPTKCITGQDCRICFGDADNTCMIALYRGHGPGANRFDFTAAFYDARCGAANLPKAFSDECTGLSEGYKQFTKKSIYCLADPTARGCAAIIDVAKEAKAKDEPFWQECKSLGVVAFNQKYAAQPKNQRDLECAYSKLRTGGPNKKGEVWRRVMPAACPANTYVGQDGLDCCDGSKMSVAGYGRECKIFLAPKS